SKEKSYWNPEQPPPSTATRIMTGLASLEARKAMRLAALSVTEKEVSLMLTRCGGWAASSRRALSSGGGLCRPPAGLNPLAMQDIQTRADHQRESDPDDRRGGFTEPQIAVQDGKHDGDVVEWRKQRGGRE